MLSPESGPGGREPLAGEEVATLPCVGIADQESGDSALRASAEPTEPQPHYWQACLVVTPVFMGYAALFGLQHFVKERFGIKDDSSSASHAWGTATSFLYIFNLIFRVGHNVVFGCFSPRQRVLISMTFMTLSMATLGVLVMWLEWYEIYWVALAYAFGGISVGSFESNILGSLTPLGHRTKVTSMLGVPIGIVAVLVGANILIGPPFHIPVVACYVAVTVATIVGMLIFVIFIPKVSATPGMEIKGQLGLKKFASDCRQWRHWLPQLWHYPLAMTLDSFSLSCFSPGVALFIYNEKTIELIPGIWSMSNSTFFAMFSVANMIGSVLGRSISYRMRPRHALVYTVINIAGIACLLTRVPLLAPLASFLIMLGDGLIYGTISKHIDTKVPKEYNLTAISYWLFIGDFGSVIGSNLISYVRDWIVG